MQNSGVTLRVESQHFASIHDDNPRVALLDFPCGYFFFVPLFLHTNIFKGNPVSRKAHQIVKYLKIKTDESEYRTQGTNVSLS